MIAIQINKIQSSKSGTPNKTYRTRWVTKAQRLQSLQTTGKYLDRRERRLVQALIRHQAQQRQSQNVGRAAA